MTLATLIAPVPFEWVAIIIGALVTVIGVLWKAWQESREDSRKRWERINYLEDRAAERAQANAVFRAEVVEVQRSILTELQDIRRALS